MSTSPHASSGPRGEFITRADLPRLRTLAAQAAADSPQAKLGLSISADTSTKTTPRAGIPRKTITDKLGVPEDATDAQALAALDARLAGKKQSAATASATSRHQSADEALYGSVYGESTAEAATPAEDALYAAYTGTASTTPAAAARDEDELWARVMGS